MPLQTGTKGENIVNWREVLMAEFESSDYQNRVTEVQKKVEEEVF